MPRSAPVAAFAVRSALPLALLLAVTSVCAVTLPSTYARETATWAAQGFGQDVVNLALVVPWVALAGARAARGSRKALLRRRALGWFLSPILLAFALLMVSAIGGMIVTMVLRGVSSGGGVALLFALVALGTLVVLARLLAAVREEP